MDLRLPRAHISRQIRLYLHFFPHLSAACNFIFFNVSPCFFILLLTIYKTSRNRLNKRQEFIFSLWLCLHRGFLFLFLQTRKGANPFL